MTKKRPRGADLPPLSRRYHIARILRTRNELVRVLLSEYGHGDWTIPPGGFPRFVEIVAEQLSGRFDYRALEESLRPLIGVPLSEPLLVEYCHRIAGNIPRLRDRRTVVPWAVQRFPEWVPVQILRVDPVILLNKDRGMRLSFKILAGTPCPRVVLPWWSLKRCAFVSQDLGFDRPRRGKHEGEPGYYYQTPYQLVSLRFDGLVDVERSVTEPCIVRVRSSAQHKRWNRHVLRKRFRIDPDAVCPQGYSHACHVCPVGYVNCPAATHREDYVLRHCPRCGRESEFDPEVTLPQCVDCTNTLYREGTL